MTTYSKHELIDVEAEQYLDASCPAPPCPKKGLKNYWLIANTKNLDGLPGMLSGYKTMTKIPPPRLDFKEDDEGEPGIRIHFSLQTDVKLALAFLTGAIVSASYFRAVRS